MKFECHLNFEIFVVLVICPGGPGMEKTSLRKVVEFKVFRGE